MEIDLRNYTPRPNSPECGEKTIVGQAYMLFLCLCWLAHDGES